MATASIASIAAVDSDTLYEVINGEIVELPPMGIFEGLIASLLDRQLQCYMATRGTGWIVTEILFAFSSLIGNNRRPDLAYVSYDRWPQEKPVPRGNEWDVVREKKGEKKGSELFSNSLNFHQTAAGQGARLTTTASTYRQTCGTE
jgi:hypothetical protein